MFFAGWQGLELPCGVLHSREHIISKEVLM
jgi:hypothetical protein